MDDRIWLTLPQPCPACGAPNDGHWWSAGTKLGPPEVGDASVCAYCHTIGIYWAEGIRLPTRDEAQRLAADDDVQAAVRASKEGTWRS
jgi:hypothetical protein